jgi:fumarylpyruvate hydrolase
MTPYLFDPPPPPSLAIVGDERRYPVARIFCVGRNY